MKRMDPVDRCSDNLHLAARTGNAETLAALLENEHVRLCINDRDSDGNTPLYLAARKRCAPAIRVLLDHGADITVRSLNSNRPPEPPTGKGPRINLNISPSYTPLHGWCIGFAQPTDDFQFIEQQDIIPASELLLGRL
jgi:ankyrin repeat protein